MIFAYIDGGVRGNPGSGALGFVVMHSKEGELFRYGKKIDYCTNNYAEYKALTEVLQYLNNKNFNDSNIIIYSDSELLVNQMNGIYKVRSNNIHPLFEKAQSIFKKMKNIQIEHISRKDNYVADWIVNRVLNGETY